MQQTNVSAYTSLNDEMQVNTHTHAHIYDIAEQELNSS